MSFEKAGGGPGEGLFPALRRVRVRFTDAAVVGDHMMFDMDTTTLTFGEGGAPGSDAFNTVKDMAVSATALRRAEGYFYGFAEEVTAAGADGWVTVRGKFTGVRATAGMTFGHFGVPDTTTDGTVAAATGSTGGKLIVLCTSLVASGQCNGIVNGIEGFGNDV